MSYIKRIEHDGLLLAIVISSQIENTESTFYTTEQSILQVGHIILGPNKPIQRHFHNKVIRETEGTGEVLVLIDGSVQMTVYDLDLLEVQTEILLPGDVICLFNGGHGFTATEVSTFIEVKNGPYAGQADKIFF